jgi:hypothetical protein
MLVAVVNHPSVPALFDPMALQADPFHLTTWSAFARPATSDPSVPTYTSVPLAASARTYASSAQLQPPPPEPMACQVPPGGR